MKLFGNRSKDSDGEVAQPAARQPQPHKPKVEFGREGALEIEGGSGGTIPRSAFPRHHFPMRSPGPGAHPLSGPLRSPPQSSTPGTSRTRGASSPRGSSRTATSSSARSRGPRPPAQVRGACCPTAQRSRREATRHAWKTDALDSAHLSRLRYSADRAWRGAPDQGCSRRWRAQPQVEREALLPAQWRRGANRRGDQGRGAVRPAAGRGEHPARQGAPLAGAQEPVPAPGNTLAPRVHQRGRPGDRLPCPPPLLCRSGAGARTMCRRR